MSKQKNEKDALLNEWTWIYVNYHKYPLIIDVNRPKISIATLGLKIDHIKPSNYSNIYTSIYEEEQYSIYLSDESFICFYYIFDKEGNIIGHNLMYIPSPMNEDGNTPELAYARYIRVDYDQDGHKNVIHTQVHLHVGVHKTEFRIPVAHYLTPREFLYIILKYIYHSEDVFTDKLLDKRKRRKSILTIEENEALKLFLGV